MIKKVFKYIEKVIKNIFLKIIVIYQKYITHAKSPYPRCKYYPTCSEYAKQCFEKEHLFKAIFKTLWRILRCNPFSRGGFDPVK